MSWWSENIDPVTEKIPDVDAGELFSDVEETAKKIRLREIIFWTITAALLIALVWVILKRRR